MFGFNLIKEEDMNSNSNLALCQQRVYERDLIDSKKYSIVVQKLREFFLNKNFIEVPTQSRLSILAACEDPTTVRQYKYHNQIWPLPQTGQMWLEYELLNNPKANGFFCISTSYREEPNPIPGRHKTIFPMFEFETHGDMYDLIVIEKEIIEYLGISEIDEIKEIKYEDAAKYYNVSELETKHENMMEHDFGRVQFLTHFPVFTSPFWNMKMEGDISNKVDVIIAGQETIGSAERATDKQRMREMFLTISEGEYSQLIFDKFGKDRVLAELDDFLKLDFFPRFGGGIGVTRMVSAMEKYNLL